METKRIDLSTFFIRPTGISLIFIESSRNVFSIFGVIEYLQDEFETFIDSKGVEHRVSVNKIKRQIEITEEDCNSIMTFPEFDSLPGFEGLTLKYFHPLDKRLPWQVDDLGEYVYPYQNHLDWCFMEHLIKERKEDFFNLGIELYRPGREWRATFKDVLFGEKDFECHFCGDYYLRMKPETFFSLFWENKKIKDEVLEVRKWEILERDILKVIKKTYKSSDGITAAATMLKYRAKFHKVITYKKEEVWKM